MSHPDLLRMRRRILLIDDTPANLVTLGAALSEEFEVQIATSGAQGIALAQGYTPDLILLDVMMPEMDGYETCRRLKATPSLATVPVIFISALTELEAESSGLALGAADYITKPVNVAITRQRIRNLMEREHLRRKTELQRAELETQLTELRVAKAVRDEALERLQKIAARVPGVVYQYCVRADGSAFFPFASEAIQQIYRVSPEDVLQDAAPVFAVIHPDDIAGIERSIEESRAQLRPWKYEYRVRFTDGVVRWLFGNSLPEAQEDGSTLWHGFITDITERKLAEEKLQLAASVFSSTREGIVIVNSDGTIIDVNAAFTDITGYTHDDAVGNNPRLLQSGHHTPEFYSAMWHELTTHGHWAGEIWNRRKSGEIYTEFLTITAIPEGPGRSQKYLGMFADISLAKLREQRLEHMAHFDPLTELPNRLLLQDRLEQAMAQVERRNKKLMVAFIDLDCFKEINDVHGHDIGDMALITLASRMKYVLREGDTLSRLGGDEFVALFIDIEQADDSTPLLLRLLEAASDPIALGTEFLHVSASIGATFYPQNDRIDASDLLQQADKAMYDAKAAGKNRFVFHDEASS